MKVVSASALARDCSLGTRHRKLIISRDESNRVGFPTAASTIIAVTESIPRNTIRSSTTARNDQRCNASRI